MNKQSPIPTREIPSVAWRRVIRELRQRTARRKPRTLSVGTSIQELAKKFWIRQEPRFFGIVAEQTALIPQFFPAAYEQTLREADQILAHRFDILGSGITDLGKEINWHRDFKSGHTWPLEHYTRLELVNAKGGFDVKVPWELSRFHHTLRLGQAYLYTMDERYAAEIVEQVRHWLERNPYEFGVNWAGPMDVAIRAVNWVWSLYMILESKTLTEKVLALWLNSFKQHGEYLASHLEDGWPHTNHLIANLAGLAYLGIIFPEFSDAARWRSTGLKRLWEELDRQVYPDGMDYEASIGYHRLVTEIGLSVAGLCLVNGIKIPQSAQIRLSLMADALMSYTPPDGMAPQIGDWDDGRFLPLTIHADKERQSRDHRHLLGLASILLEREMPEWAGFVDPLKKGWAVAAGNEWQDALWYYPSDGSARYTDLLTRTTERPENLDDEEWVTLPTGLRFRARALSNRPISLEHVAASRAFQASGLYIMRDKDCHLTIDAGDVGTEGTGGHAHNDLMSITLQALGETFLADPGTYVYTSHPEERNRFRSTASHNVLQIGDHESNPIPERELFRLPGKASLTLHHWISDEEFDFFDGSHDGYARLNPPLIHRRQIWFDKVRRLWILHDEVKAAPDLSGNGSHAHDDPVGVTLWFHLPPGLTLHEEERHDAFYAEAKSGKGLVIMPLGEFPLKAALTTGGYAPRYGVKVDGPVVQFTGQVKLPIDLVLLLSPHRKVADANLKGIRTEGRAALVGMKSRLSGAPARIKRGQ